MRRTSTKADRRNGIAWASALAALMLTGVILAADAPNDERAADVVAVTNVKIVVKPGDTIEGGTILIRDGLIVDVGPRVRAPLDARPIDGAGLTAYPAFIDAATALSAVNMDARASQSGADRTIDRTRVAPAKTYEVNRNGIFPEFSAARHLQVDGAQAARWRQAGFGAVHALPGGAILAGAGAIVLLTDDADAPRRDSVVRADSALVAGWGAGRGGRGGGGGGGTGYPSSLMGVIAHMRQTLLDAQHYAASWDVYSRNSGEVRRPPYDAALEALQPALRGEKPVIFPVSNADEIQRALAMAAEFGMKPILLGAEEAHDVIDLIQSSNAQVILSVSYPDRPRAGQGGGRGGRRGGGGGGRGGGGGGGGGPAIREVPESPRILADRLAAWEKQRANAAALYNAGVRFALSTSGNNNPDAFFEKLRGAIEAGLPVNAALHALTIAPAQILGLDRELGTIERGKIANIALMTGDFDNDAARVRIAIIDGVVYDMGAQPDASQGGRLAPQSNDGEQAPQQPAAAGDEIPVETDDDRRPSTVTGGSVFIRNANVVTAINGELENVSISVVNGVIRQIGPNLTPARGQTVIDGAGVWVMPGIIDSHSHMAASGINEGTESITAMVRIQDVLRSHDLTMYRAAAGGVTTANILHGSANSIGGQRAVIQMKYFAPVSEMTFPNYYPGIKFALGENVIRNQSRFPNTRMGVEATIRRGLRDAQMYQAEWDEYNAFSAREKRRTIPPRRDLRLEALAGILKGEILVHCHSYNMDEIFMILKTLSDFGVRHMTLEHALEAYKIAPEVAAFGDAGAYMSTFADGWAYKIEAWDAIPYNVALIEEAGGNPIINSDSGNTVRWLYLEAAKMVRYGGLTYQDAIQTITYNTARALKIDDRAGTVEVDKKADIALYNGHPLNTYARPFMTLIDGEVVFERKGERGGPHPLPAKRDIAPTVPATNADGRYAIVNATIHPVSGPTIQRGTVVIENGRIAAVGANVTAPAGATVVNAEGLHVYPGLIDGGGTVGLNEIGSIGETNDANESGNIQPDIRAAAAVKPDSVVVGVTRFTGITSAVARPTGGAIPGQSALIQLDGWTPAEMAYVPELTLEVSLPGGGANVDFDRIMNANYTGGGNFKTLMELFAKARDYGARKRAAEAADARFPELDHQLEALLPYAEKRRKVVLAASGAVDILTAIDFAAALDIDAIIRGAGDGWRVADKLAASGIPCIIGPVLTTPGSYEPYDMAYANAARMHEAGVKFGFQSNDSANARNMPFEAGTAVAFGLPADVALRACTLTTAEIYGVDGEVGSIDVGKRADIIVVDRDPLQATSNVITMFINGKPVDVEDNKHTQLYKRYQRRIADEPR